MITTMQFSPDALLNVFVTIQIAMATGGICLIWRISAIDKCKVDHLVCEKRRDVCCGFKTRRK